MKHETLFIFLCLFFFLFLGMVSATDVNNASDMENLNLIQDDVSSSNQNIKLEVSNEESISYDNMVSSPEDNLDNYSEESSLCSTDYENNFEEQVNFNDDELDKIIIAYVDDHSLNLYGNPSLTSNSIATQLNVYNTHYTKSATYFDVTLKDSNGKALSNQNIQLKIKGKSYSAITNKNGVALVKTDKLDIGTYTISLTYAGNSNYTSSLLSKKIKVLSSVTGNNLRKYCGLTAIYKATFWKYNRPLANTKVSFKINGKTYTKTTNGEGVVSLKLKWPVGKYVITTTNPLSKQKISNKLVVKKDHSVVKGLYSKTYFTPNQKHFYSFVLKSKHGAPIKNAKVKVRFNNSSFIVKTNSNGKSTIYIPHLDLGTYKIYFRFSGNHNYYADSGKGSIIVKKSTVKLSASNLKMIYNDGSKFKVKLTTLSGKALPNKNININIGGKSSNVKTNNNGYAKLKIRDIAPGKYKVTYFYSSKNTNIFGSKTLKVSKAGAILSASNLVMNKGDGSKYQVTVKDKSGNLLKKVFVKSTINGKSYLYSTDSKGVAKLKINCDVGYYSIITKVSDPCYTSKTISKHVLVNGTKFVADDLYITSGNSGTFSVKLVDAMKNPIKNVDVVFKFNDESSKVKTDSNGVAKLKLTDLSKGKYVIKYSHGSVSDSSNVYVVSKVTLKQIISSSKSVKNYIANNGKLPTKVTIGDISFSTSEYLYLASKAIVNLKADSENDVRVMGVDDPSNPKSSADLGNLYDYLMVAKRVINYAESKHIMPNSVKSDVGTIGYDGLVDAFSRVIAYYANNKRLPNYVSIKSVSGSSSLNTKNTISDLTDYLAASINCQVNNAQIKELVTKLTKDCVSDSDKANAIFTYVRDTLSYTFYYNTKFGAVGTLKVKKGNCVDHSHLLVAMFRTAGMAARYVHGTCTFSSGSTYGHVWTQVLIGNTWTVADGTSSKNSLGKVANWNADSYILEGYSSSISF